MSSELDLIFVQVNDKELDNFFLLLESIGIFGIDSDMVLIIKTTDEIKSIIEKSQLFHPRRIKFIVNNEDIQRPADLTRYLNRVESFATKKYKFLYLKNVIVKENLKHIFDKIAPDDKNMFVSPAAAAAGAKIILFTNSYTEDSGAGAPAAVTIDAQLIENTFIFASTKEVLSGMIDKKINDIVEKTKKYIQDKLLPLIENIGEDLEGNIFSYNSSYNSCSFTDDFSDKRKNICYAVLNKLLCKNVAEIGFNSGFSTLLMLISNNNIQMTCFDLIYHKYTAPCFAAISADFPGRLVLIGGDSKKTFTGFIDQISENDVFDVIHVDGSHRYMEVVYDIANSIKLAVKKNNHGSHIIIDDYDSPHINDVWNSYKEDGRCIVEKSRVYLHETRFQDIGFIRGGAVAVDDIVIKL